MPSPTISSGSGSRPAPVSFPVKRPEAGSITWTPRERSVATFATVAGCSHISVCIAGANTTGHRAVSKRRGQQIVRAAHDRSRHQVSGGRRDDDEIGFLPEPDMRNLGHVGEHAGVHRVAGQCLECCAADELQRRLGRNHSDVMAVLGEAADERSTLLYAAIPPPTPTTMRTYRVGASALPHPNEVRVRQTWCSLAFGVLEEISVDLAQARWTAAFPADRARPEVRRIRGCRHRAGCSSR